MTAVISGRENYRRAIEFRGPEYLPCVLGVDADRLDEKDPSKRERIEELAGRFPNDVMMRLDAAAGQRYSAETRDDSGTWVDEWGTGWEEVGGAGKTRSHPMADGYDALDTYPFPDPRLPGRFDAADERLRERGGRYTQARVWFTLFERLWMLRGFENMLTDPYVHPAEFCALRDRVVEFNLAIIDRWVERGIDAVFFSDDWGSQRSLLMDPDDWRRIYKPSYARLFERVRSGGAHVWMHLCGNVTAIVADLLDIGLNVLNPVQPQAMDVKALAGEFGGKLCFNGGVDVQGTLIHGTVEDVKREVRELAALFGRFDGGYIGGTSHVIMPETPLDNVIAMLEAFLE